METQAGSAYHEFLYDPAGVQVGRSDRGSSFFWQYLMLGEQPFGKYQDGKTYFLHWNSLKSTSFVTDQTGTTIEDVLYTPWGQQWSLAGTNKAQHFAGLWQDPESGLDHADFRKYYPNLGRWMTPDVFWKDSHVGDPQSWNKYAYVRNNPLRYTDPTGQNATVSTSCSTDPNDHTTCNVTITATIAIYAVPGSGLTQNQLNAAASKITNSIDSAWSGSFDQNGVSYHVSTQVSVQVAGSEADASKAGAQNVIGLSNGPADASIDANALTGAGNSIRTLLRGQDTGVWNYNTLGTDSLNTAAHEFTHLLGVDDKPGSVLSSTYPELEPSRATAADFGWGIQEATQRVNSTLHPGVLTRFFGGAPPSNFSNRVNVGAPLFGWWK